MFSFDSIFAGERLALCFHIDEDARPPYSLKVRAPNGGLILDRILREIPTGLPQSAPPIEFIASAPGPYAIEVRELSGPSWGTAILTVTSG